VGSGFDVSAAVFGSQLYTRFNKSVIAGTLDSYQLSGFSDALSTCVLQAKWDETILPFSLPDGMDLIMGDVCGGSETPSMVRKVLEWRHASIGAHELWSGLGATNHRLAQTYARLRDLSVSKQASYRNAISKVARTVGANWETLITQSMPDEDEKRALEFLVELRRLSTEGSGSD
jgi:phosphomevalonate kinase